MCILHGQPCAWYTCLLSNQSAMSTNSIEEYPLLESTLAAVVSYCTISYTVLWLHVKKIGIEDRAAQWANTTESTSNTSYFLSFDNPFYQSRAQTNSRLTLAKFLVNKILVQFAKFTNFFCRQHFPLYNSYNCHCYMFLQPLLILAKVIFMAPLLTLM